LRIPENEQPAIPEQPMVCINPEIVFASQEEEVYEEGCFSIPNLPLKIKRPKSVKIRYSD